MIICSNKPRATRIELIPNPLVNTAIRHALWVAEETVNIRVIAMLLTAALAPLAAAADAPPASTAAANAPAGAQPADASGTSAANTAPAPEASIPFANHGGIYNWRVVNDRTVLIQSQSRRWYKATLLSSCIDLPFAERLGFESNADGSFDKFSMITARHQRCPLISLVETAAPSKKLKPAPAGHS
jgi:hypothetical protein